MEGLDSHWENLVIKGWGKEQKLKESGPMGWWRSTITGSLEFLFCAEGLYCCSFQKQFRKDHVHLILELFPKHLAHDLKDSFEPFRSEI